ncbi:MAG: nitroreductase family protein [Bacteroidetes bacterium]|nr:nitroreductase family protein [Bacteroidota bacterium]
MIDTIMQHRSVRQYKDDPVPVQVLDTILTAGIRASNTGNMQVYSIVVTKDKDLREQLWEVHFKQEMVRQAPVVLTFCADINRFGKWCKQRNAVPEYDNFLWFINASIDAVIAAQNVALAAEEYGMGICYLGTTTYMADRIIRILELPAGVVPVTTLVVGYPGETPEPVDRLPLEGVIHQEKYKDYSSDDIDRIYAGKESLEQTRELIRINETDNLAQIFTDKRYIKKDNVHFSRQYLDVIEKQGFLNNK